MTRRCFLNIWEGLFRLGNGPIKCQRLANSAYKVTHFWSNALPEKFYPYAPPPTTFSVTKRNTKFRGVREKEKLKEKEKDKKSMWRPATARGMGKNIIICCGTNIIKWQHRQSRSLGEIICQYKSFFILFWPNILSGIYIAQCYCKIVQLVWQGWSIK